MKLSEYKNEEAIELLADILDPLADVLSDPEVQRMARGKKTNRMQAVSYLLKNHPGQIMKIMARIDQTPVEEYEVNVLSLPIKLLEILNDKELISFFRSQGQTLTAVSSGSVTEISEETEKI